MRSDRELQSEHLTARQQQAQARREQIIEAAVQLFARQGFDGTSTKQIARAVGITEGLIFHYFPTKADLLNATLETRHAFLIELRSMLAEAEGQPVRAVLSLLAERWLELLKREEAITLVFYSTAQTNPQVGMAFQALVHEGKGRLSAYLQTRMQAGELRPDLPLDTSSHMFLASLFMFFLIYRSLPDDTWQECSQTFARELVATWLQGASCL